MVHSFAQVLAPAKPAKDDVVARAYAPADLSEYPWKKRLQIRAIARASYFTINLICRTMKFEVEGWSHWQQATANGSVPIYTFWHDGIVPSTYFWRNRGIVVMTSQSFDGEYIARFIQRFGYGAARGSSTRGAVGAVIEMVRVMRQGIPTAFTIDGPKGPRRVAKMGAVLLAKKSGHPILPFKITPSRCWTLSKSWDRLTIPKLFSRARVEIAEPIYVPAEAEADELETHRLRLQQTLDRLDANGEQWTRS